MTGQLTTRYSKKAIAVLLALAAFVGAAAIIVPAADAAPKSMRPIGANFPDN